MPRISSRCAHAGRCLLVWSFVLATSSCNPERATIASRGPAASPPSALLAPAVSANPGGPYAGVEGEPIIFDGTGSQGDELQYNWDFGDATPHGAGATPSHAYADNKIYTVKLFVTDVNGVKSTTVQTTVTVANARPVLAELTAPVLPPRAGLAFTLSTSFTDAGTADTYNGTFTWGDTKTSAATVKAAAGSGTVTGSHSYAAAGTYAVSLRVADDNGGADTVALELVVGPRNQIPTAIVGGPYTGVEGSPVSFDGSGSTDPDADSLRYDWDFGDGSVHDTTAAPTHTYTDNKSYTVKLLVTDAYGARSTASQTTAVITNAAPVIGSFAGPASAALAGSATTVQASFTDAGARDTYSAAFDWGDASSTNGTIVQSDGTGTVTGKHTYAAAGQYVVRLRLKDNGGGADTATLDLTVLGKGGSLKVVATTVGADIDPDGYTAIVDSETTQPIAQPVASNGNATFAALSSTSHTVTLAGLAANCSIGSTRQTVTVTAGTTSQATFAVFCMAAHASTYTFVGAGDIADCMRDDDEATANVLGGVVAGDPATVVYTLGDNVYDAATAAEITDCYAPSWGRQKVRTFATMGNHEYKIDPNPSWDYFGSRAGPRGLGYYSYNLGDYWHVVVLSDNGAYGGPSRSAGSTQDLWLQADLAANTRPCIIAMWHQPFVASDNWYSASRKNFWDRLYAAGAEIVLNGHLHQYERQYPQTPDLVRDDARGIRQFIVGTGGETTQMPDSLTANTEVVSSSKGVLKLTLGAGTYSWEFLWAKGDPFTDSGSGTCH